MIWAQVRTLLVVIALLPLLGGCAITPANYADQQPELRLEKFFTGDLKAWGIFQDYTNKVTNRFVVDMKGTWNGKEGMLEEWFTYADGTKQTRTWKFVAHADGRYTGVAGDVIGTAEGQAAGNAFQFEYVLALAVDDDVYHVHMDDWMFLVDENTLINRTDMKKFGVKVGEVTLIIQKNSVGANL